MNSVNFSEKEIDDLLNKADNLCDVELFDKAKEICFSVIDNDPTILKAYIILLKAESCFYTIFEGENIEKYIRIINRLDKNNIYLNDSELSSYLEKRNNQNLEDTIEEEKFELYSMWDTMMALNECVFDIDDENICYDIINSCLHYGQDGYLTFLSKLYEDSTLDETLKKELIKQREKCENNENGKDTILGIFYEYGLGTEIDFYKSKKYYEKAALNNDLFALCKLGTFYRSGRGCEKDLELSNFYLNKTLENNYPYGIYELARNYEYGRGVIKDSSKALKLYQKAVDLNYGPAMVKLAKIYELIDGNRGYGEFDIEHDDLKALELYEKASEFGDYNALMRQGYFYEHGRGVKKDFSKAKHIYVVAYDLGDPKKDIERIEQKIKGPIFLDVKGNLLAKEKTREEYLKYNFSKDVLYSINYYAEQLNPMFLNMLGYSIYYISNNSNKQNEKYAFWEFLLYEKAASLGFIVSLRNLGLMYENGNGTEVDLVKARDCYLEAANKKDDSACYQMGYCYENGYLVKKDLVKSLYYYEKAAEYGDAYSCIIVGDSYITGKIREKNVSKAIEYYNKAIERGKNEAYTNLGIIYGADDAGTYKDYNKAIYCFKKAIESGDELAKPYLNDVLRKMDDFEI